MVIAAVVALLALITGEAWTNREVEFRAAMTFGYAVVSLLPVISMTIMLRSQAAAGQHAYDRNAVRFMRWAAISSFMLVVAITVAAGNGRLPGQRVEEFRLPIVGAKEFKWKEAHPEFGIAKGDDGLRVFFVLCGQAILRGKEVPNPLPVEISLGNRVGASWQIVPAVEGDHVTECGLSSHDPIPLEQRSGGRTVGIHWRDLQSRQMYVLTVKLHQRKPSVSPKQLRSMVMEDHDDVLAAKLFYPK
jgi:hypothetical protein